jgi:MarR family transcriptional regulator, transcriptional regulator for hemolysin
MDIHPDHDPLLLIVDLARLIRTHADQLARQKKMTRAQWAILVRVSLTPGLSQSELAQICEVEPIGIARLADRLEARGLIERQRDPADRRIKRLYLTAAARPLLQEIRSYGAQMIAEATDGLSKETVAAIMDGLFQMKANLSGREPMPVRLRSAG